MLTGVNIHHKIIAPREKWPVMTLLNSNVVYSLRAPSRPLYFLDESYQNLGGKFMMKTRENSTREVNMIKEFYILL